MDHPDSLQETTTGATIGVTTEAMTGDMTGTMSVMKNEIIVLTGLYSTPWVVNLYECRVLNISWIFFPLQTPITIPLLQQRLPLTVPLTVLLSSYVKTTCSFLTWHLIVTAFVSLTLCVFNRSLLSQQDRIYRIYYHEVSVFFLFFFLIVISLCTKADKSFLRHPS